MTAFFRLLAAALAAGSLGMAGYGVYLMARGFVSAGDTEVTLIVGTWAAAAAVLAARAARPHDPPTRGVLWAVATLVAGGWLGWVAYLWFVVGPVVLNTRFVVLVGFIVAAACVSAAGLLLDARPAGAADDEDYE